MSWGVFLDLDETLVQTAQLEPLRRARRWREVYESFHLTHLPPGTKAFVKVIRSIGMPGVVTSAPRTYAERLLEFHRIPLPVLIAYHDVSYRKPHPEPLLKAAEKLNIVPSRCFYIGDSPDDVAAASAAGVTFVGICWDTKSLSACQTPTPSSWGEVLAAIRRAMGLEGGTWT